MTHLLFEQPWIVGGIGAILTGMTLFGWVQTGNAAALRAAVGVAAVTVVLVAINIWTVTDSETVRVWLLETAQELERNEQQKILARIHPSSSDHVNQLVQVLPTVKFRKVKVTRIHSVEVDYKRLEPQAKIRFNVHLEAESRYGAGQVLRWVELTLEKSEGKWLVFQIEDRVPQYEFMKSKVEGPVR